MAFQYPAKPWVDGQEIKMTVGGRETVVAKYDASKNLWQHLQVNELGVFNYVYACQITIDRAKCPADPCLETISWDNIKDVQTALDWIYLRLQELFEKVELLEERVKQNEIDIDFLYKTLSAIDNLADIADFIERLELIEAQLPVYADEIRQGSRLNGRIGELFVSLDDYVPPPGIVKGTQQETNSYLWDYISKVTYFGDTPPAPDQIEFTFWYDTTRLELFINYNGVWFPVSVPPKDYDVEVNQLGYSINRLEALAAEAYLKNTQQDGRLDGIENDIIELEEEIEALAPSLERGQWNYKQILENRAYSLFDSSGQTTDMFNNVASIYVSTIDAAGNPHGFDDVVAGSYVEIFNDTDADFGLYVVKDVDDKSNMNPGYWIFTVDFIKSNRLPSKANGLARFKFFEAPTGGDISELAPPTPTFLFTPPMKIHSVDNVPFNLSPIAGEIQPLGRFTTQSAADFYISDTKYYRISKNIFEETFPDGIENYTFMPGQMLFYGAAHQQSAAGSHPSNQGIYMAIDFQLVNDRYYEITVMERLE
jgi:hypothetical protein